MIAHHHLKGIFLSFEDNSVSGVYYCAQWGIKKIWVISPPFHTTLVMHQVSYVNRPEASCNKVLYKKILQALMQELLHIYTPLKCCYGFSFLMKQ